MRNVMYIVINQDLKELMDYPGRIGAHTAHAVFDYTYNNYNKLLKRNNIDSYSELLNSFKNGGDTIVVLKASNSDMIKWESEGYLSVREKGISELEPTSITAINLGIYDKNKGIPQWIQRLRLL